MKKKKIIPFSMLPASWGLSGKTRAIAEAEYYYEGEDLEKILAEINADGDQEKMIAKLDVDLKYSRISKDDYNKKVAEIKQEPYVNVLELGIDPSSAKAGYVELDWNDHFVKFLHENGYTGTSDEDIVNTWFNDVCRTILIQEKADLDYGLEETGREDVVRKTNEQPRRNSKGKTSKTSKDD